ncbi:MAG: hypothetical protein QW379_10225 [Thermoplasmata archaeon]
MRKGTTAGIGSVIALLILSGIPMSTTAEDDDYYISGTVYFYNGTNQSQVPDCPVTLTYVPTRDRLEIMTNEDGYYEFNLADLEGGYEAEQYAEITVEPYICEGLLIPAPEGVIYIDPNSQNSYHNIYFNIENGMIEFLYDVSLFLNLQGNAVIPGGLGVWDFTNPVHYYCDNNPVALTCGCSVSMTNNQWQTLYVWSTWTFSVQNEYTNDQEI